MSSALYQIINSSLKEPRDACFTAAGFSEESSAVYVLDRSGTIIDTNEALIGFTGIPLEEISGKRLADFLDDAARQVLETMIKDEDPTGVHAFYGAINTDSKIIKVRALVHPLFDEDGRAMGFVVHMQAKEDGSEPVHSRLSPEELLPLISDAVIECDHTMRISYANDVGLRIFGCECPEQISGREVTGLIHPDDREKVLQLLEDCFAENLQPHFSARLLRNGKSGFPGEVRVCSSGEGEAKILRMIIKDLSVNKEARRFRKLFQTVIGLRPEGVVLVEEDGGIELANNELARIFGYVSADHMKGININEIIDSRILKVLTGPEKERLESVSLQMVRARAVRKDGEEFRAALTGLVITDELGEPDGLVFSICELNDTDRQHCGLQANNSPERKGNYE